MSINASANLVVVTGTTSGIGASLAASLVERGWTVMGVARRTASITHPHYEHYECDLSVLSDVAAFVEHDLRERLMGGRWKRVGLVNNAASTGQLDGLEQAKLEKLATVFAVNTVAPIHLMSSVARMVPSQTALRIVNLTSGAGVHAFPGLGDYGASKAALRLAAMVLAAELGSNDRPGGPHPNFGVLSYSPGTVDTAMQAQARARASETPWNQAALTYAAAGLLRSASEVTRPIADFLEADDVSPFAESRFNG